MHFALTLLPLLSTIVNVAVALPNSIPLLNSIPPNAAKIAHDPKSDLVIAYDIDDHILGQLPSSVGFRAMKRQGGSCVKMSPNDITNLPGWEKLAQYAKDNWGDGWDTVDANPADYPDSGAILCVAGDVTPVVLSGEPQCQTQTQSTGGSIVGADGTVTLSAKQGTSQQTTMTVTQASSLAVGASVAVKVGIPDIAEVTGTLTTTVEFTNTLSTSNSFTSSNEQTQSVTLENSAGKTCSLTFNVQSCDFTGTGTVRMLASGWAWLYYPKQRNGHYKWAMSIDVILADESDRQSLISFTTSTSSTTSSQYNAVCQ